eukprot:TRINITY_DN17261_c0_g1_i1.p1 TRINITY_DN17261_c0_g1~~TRINITY_DN17261_c0_g1_i1.p1  ORF type:complete len:200 (-),score=0.45 TRINITY_DN17261_c0_g1_i1:64-663(-)
MGRTPVIRKGTHCVRNRRQVWEHIFLALTLRQGPRSAVRRCDGGLLRHRQGAPLLRLPRGQQQRTRVDQSMPALPGEVPKRREQPHHEPRRQKPPPGGRGGGESGARRQEPLAPVPELEGAVVQRRHVLRCVIPELPSHALGFLGEPLRPLIIAPRRDEVQRVGAAVAVAPAHSKSKTWSGSFMAAFHAPPCQSWPAPQ